MKASPTADLPHRAQSVIGCDLVAYHPALRPSTNIIAIITDSDRTAKYLPLFSSAHCTCCNLCAPAIQFSPPTQFSLLVEPYCTYTKGNKNTQTQVAVIKFRPHNMLPKKPSSADTQKLPPGMDPRPTPFSHGSRRSDWPPARPNKTSQTKFVVFKAPQTLPSWA